MERIRYTFKYKQSIYDYIMNSNLLSDRAHEKKILELIVKGWNCYEIGEETGYSERTIQRRRQSIYNKTKDLML